MQSSTNTNLISLAIPTRNEEKNIAQLISGISNADIPQQFEIVIVDDSNDRTTEIASERGCRIVKGKRRGLGQAIIDGIEASQGDIIVVMDADLSHRPIDIHKLLRPILEQGYDMTIGSRYIRGGKTEGWSLRRKIISRVACLLALPITAVRDSTSGFFAFRKSILQGTVLKSSSWKIILEILAKANPTAVKEVPITFAVRQAGKSKFNTRQVMAYLKHLVLLALYKYRALIKFGFIGASGALIHFSLLYVLTDWARLWYIASAIFSTIAASTSNYILNHKLTFTDRNIANHILGWTKYQVMSGVTNVTYLGLLALLVEVAGLWYMAAAFLSALVIFPVKFILASTAIWSKKLYASEANYEWDSFFKGSPIQKWWKQSIAKAVWEFVPSCSSPLLDIGCGSSPIISHYPNATGIDINKEKLIFLQNKLPTVTLKAMSADAMSFDRNSFNYILCVELLEHLPNPEKTIALISYILKPTGKVVIATPDYSRIHWYLFEKFTAYKEEHIYKFTRKKLEATCKKHGLVPVQYKYIAWCDLVELFEKV